MVTLRCPQPHLLGRLHVPDPRFAGGAGQRRDPAKGSGRRFDLERVCVPPAGDERWPVGLRREVLDRWLCDLERAGEVLHRAEPRDAVQEHPGTSSSLWATVSRRRAACRTTAMDWSSSRRSLAAE